MPPANKDATVIILDIGYNAEVCEDKNKKSFFENARECLCRIVERKIISRPNDLIGLILLGSKTTKNNLAEQCQGLFQNIELFKELSQPSWSFLKSIPEKTTSVKTYDWFEALLVAADHFKNDIYGTKVGNKKIVLMTNFITSADLGANVEQVLQGFKEDSFEVNVFGVDLYNDNRPKGDDVELARQFIDLTDGVSATFSSVMSYLLFHRKKATTPMPWNVDLSIGPNVKIPVSVYGRIRHEAVIKSWGKTVKDEITGKASTEEGLIKKKQFITANATVVDEDDVITGYHYGEKVIPFDDSNEVMLYKSGEKCLSVYGFTEAKNIKWHHLSGNGVSYLFGRKGDVNAQIAIDCLVQCLVELDLVGIARRVYNNGNAPAMHALIPVVDSDGYVCISVIAICFKEDIKSMPFPSTQLNKYECTKKQVDAFVDLIKNMDLTNAYDSSYDDKEAFPTAETVNPSIQYILDCIAYRAMNPDKKVPPPKDDIMMLFKKPLLIEERSKESLQNLKTLFTLKTVEKKPSKFRRFTNNNQDPGIIVNNSKKDIDIIGAITPDEDFKALIAGGKKLEELAKDMIETIETLVFINLYNDHTKALDSMACFRTEAVKTEPSHYNNWIVNFKKKLIERKFENVLKLIGDNNLNVILKAENDSSTYLEDVNEESIKYEMDTEPHMTDLEVPSYIDDMFDGM